MAKGKGDKKGETLRSPSLGLPPITVLAKKAILPNTAPCSPSESHPGCRPSVRWT